MSRSYQQGCQQQDRSEAPHGGLLAVRRRSVRWTAVRWSANRGSALRWSAVRSSAVLKVSATALPAPPYIHHEVIKTSISNDSHLAAMS